MGGIGSFVRSQACRGGGSPRAGIYTSRLYLVGGHPIFDSQTSNDQLIVPSTAEKVAKVLATQWKQYSFPLILNDLQYRRTIAEVEWDFVGMEYSSALSKLVDIPELFRSATVSVLRKHKAQISTILAEHSD